MRPRWQLTGKKALVTGGSRGIGAAVTEELAELGATTLIVARDRNSLEIRAEELRSKNLPVETCAADVSTDEGRRLVFDWVASSWGTLDILVNNVGMNIRKRATDYSSDEVERIFSTNLESALYCSTLAYPFLKKSTSSPAVVNIVSVAGLTHLRTGAPYAMTKAALVQLTRNLAVEWASDGIRVNAVAPWYTRTEMVEQLLQNREYLDAVLARTPMGRIAEPQEVADVVTFLCLPAASYVTGQCLAVDGGFLTNGF